MYKIIGADRKEYGPVTADQIRAWIAEGRVNAQTQVQPDGADWKNLGEIPEFADAFAPRTTPPPIAPAFPGAATAATEKTSGLAITSLVLGVLGVFCGITAIPGLILGIIALVKIKNSNGRLSGNGIALAGTIVSGLFLLMIPLLAAMALPAFAKAREKAMSIQCLNNSRQLAMAVRIYATDHTNQCPDAASWCDSIQPLVGNERGFKCAAATRPDQRCSYAFNSKLSGMDIEHVDPQTVMIFETDGGWNVSGGRELMVNPPRHARGVVVAFADGHAEVVAQARMQSLRWDP